MPIKKDLSNLATQPAAEGEAPDAAPRFVTALADTWFTEYLDGGNDDRAFAVPDTRFRASWAAGCSRRVAYQIDHADRKTALRNDETYRIFDALGDSRTDDQIAYMADVDEHVAESKPSNPPTVADLWRMNLGSMVHDALEHIFPAAFPGADVELAVDLRPDVDGSATSDIIVRQPCGFCASLGTVVIDNEEQRCLDCDGKGMRVIVVELKTKNGFGFKLAASTFKGAPEGPSYNHKVQAALLAHAIGADELVIGYLAMECLSPKIAESMGVGEVGRFAAEWTYTKEEFTPWAVQEHRRIRRIINLVDVEGPAAVPRAIDDPEIPAEARIDDPKRGAWTVTSADGVITRAGTTWLCGYCDYQDRCIADGPA